MTFRGRYKNPKRDILKNDSFPYEYLSNPWKILDCSRI